MGLTAGLNSHHRLPLAPFLITYYALVGLPSSIIVLPDLELSEAPIEEMSAYPLVLGRMAASLERSQKIVATSHPGTNIFSPSCIHSS